MTENLRILWADDEINLLKPHIMFLEGRGYQVTPVTNGADAVALIGERTFDVVFLDEQMPGMDGIETLGNIKKLNPEIPVVMITKSEAEDLMEDAIGSQISDYLIKPVNPNQILMTCKRLLKGRQIRNQKVSQDYLQSFNQITSTLMDRPSHETWVEVYQKLVQHDTTLEHDDGVRQILDDQFKEANKGFGRFVANSYEEWIRDSDTPADEYRPVLSHEVMPKWVFPELKKEKPVIFFLIDCMRYDQWLEFEHLLRPMFNIEKDFHYSILPTATPFSRNAIFSGMLPREIAKRYPDIWNNAEFDEHSKNRHEEKFLNDLLNRKHLRDVRVRYEKIMTAKEGRPLARNVNDLIQHDLTAMVINFVDILAHSRSDSAVLKEIAPDERAYRALTRTWFEHSWLFKMFQDLALTDATVIVTTDHGAIRSLHPTKVIGDRDTSTSLRFKYGRNLKCDERHAILIRDPDAYGLPSQRMNTDFIIARDDYYFVYPTNYNKFANHYRDTMQHGGASMEEMILPVLTLRPKQ